MLVDLLQGALTGALSAVPNMLAVLAAALLSVVMVSFFRGEVTTFRTWSLLIVFIGGTFNPLLAIAGGTLTVLVAHRRQEFDQRELATLFTLVFFAIAYYYELLEIPQITVVS
jgi:ABC-type uncharacterized transport system permease subunit